MARNEVTGKIVSSAQVDSDKDLYDAGWDRIFGKPHSSNGGFGKKQQELLDAEPEVRLYGGCLGGGKSYIVDLVRMKQALESESIMVPDDLNREDLRDFIISHAHEKSNCDKACGCFKSCGGTREEYDEDCFGWNNCSYCDNGWFPCNQNCLVFG